MMPALLLDLLKGVPLVGNIGQDTPAFLAHHGYPKTAGHCRRVAATAKRLATQFGVDPSQAETAGWLHDISVVFPNSQRIQVAHDLAVEVLPEEASAPMIIHQKLSAVMAREMFGVTDEAVLSAIGCHTTLKPDATPLDKALFVADKIEWDQPGQPPYLASIQAAVAESLDQAALCYLDYLWQRRDTLPVIHPWFVAAYKQRR
jgi:predicted HD superfamily hydrolase involved in NAD metabolism